MDIENRVSARSSDGHICLICIYTFQPVSNPVHLVRMHHLNHRAIPAWNRIAQQKLNNKFSFCSSVPVSVLDVGAARMAMNLLELRTVLLSVL